MSVLRECLNCNEPYKIIEISYYPNSKLIESYSHKLIVSKYEYDDSERIKNVYITDANGHTQDVWDEFYKKEYTYYKNGYRIFYYKTGYNLSHEIDQVEWDFSGTIEIKIPDIIHELNELLTVEEFQLDDQNNVVLYKKNDIKNNYSNNVEFKYDIKGRLIRVINQNNIIENIYDETVTSLESLYKNISIQYKNDDLGREIERIYLSESLMFDKYKFNYDDQNYIKKITAFKRQFNSDVEENENIIDREFDVDEFLDDLIVEFKLKNP